MRQSEFKRWLIEQGVEIKGGSKHLKLYYKGKISFLQNNPGEMPNATIKAIKKQLGL